MVFVGDGKGGEALEPFWARLKRQQVRLEAVATDMSPAYISAVLTHVPEATLVFDRFHVIKLYNDGLSDLRRKLYHEATDLMQKQVIKGTRWLLLKNPENLDQDRREAERLGRSLASQSTSGPGLLPEGRPAAVLGTTQQDRRQPPSWKTGLPEPKPPAFPSSYVSPRPWLSIAVVSWPITITRSPPAPWKGPTTKSRPCSAKPMASGIRNFSNSKSWLFTKPGTL